jgi:hypothetical protein
MRSMTHSAGEISASFRREAARLRAQADDLEAIALILGHAPKAEPKRRRRRPRVALPELDAAQRMAVLGPVLSSTHPTPAELADRELVHTTEAPAQAAA